MVDGNNLLGDGVNIAARLEALAEPGAIFVSAAARDHIGNKLPLAFDDLGDQQVKTSRRRSECIESKPERRQLSPTRPCRSRQAVARRLTVREHVGRPRAGIFRRRYRRGHHHRDRAASRGCS